MGARSITSITLFILVSFAYFSSGSALTCEKETIFGFDYKFDCPRPGQPDDHIFCCGDDQNRHCCPLPIDEETIKENLPKIIGVLFGIVVFVILLCVVCCCCCPFCLLAKRRRAGQVYRDGTEITVTVPAQQNTASQPLQPYPPQPQPQIQQPYPPQPGYPAQPQPGYPGQPQPGYPMQPQPGYPVPPAGATAPGYPGYHNYGGSTYHGMYRADQPPPYTEKQPAFNPNYAAA